MAGITETEVSSRLAALQSVCNLLDWEQQTAGRTGKSSGAAGVSEPLKRLRREMIVFQIKQKQPDAQSTQDTLKAAISRELAKMKERESRLTDEQAEEQARITRQAGEAWECCRNQQEKEAEQEYLKLLDAQICLLQKAAKKTEKAENTQKEPQEKEGKMAATRKEETIYEPYLSDYEPCYSAKIIDDFFKDCKREIRSILVARQKRQRQEPPIWEPKESYSIDRQKQLARFLSEYLGFDTSGGEFGESVHPFTTAFNRDWVCWSDHYVPENPFAGIFTALHETGHALYEQNLAAELSGTVLAGGCSSAMHEAVARFYENGIGRMPEFWKPIYGKVTTILGGEFERLPFLEFMRRIRQIKPGCIRTEADELTYPYHIILRYELEQELINGELTASELPEAWNRKMKEYLGITPKNAGEGYLQDIHWSCGQFGYFPAYQTGNAIAAQIYRKVQEVLPLSELLLEGRLSQLKRYLTIHIFRYGLLKNTEEILMEMTGEPLQFRYYLDYLKERYQTETP